MTKMASLFRRHNGIYYIVSSHEGKRVWRSLRTRDDTEAKNAFEEFEREQRRKSRSLISDFSEDFLNRAPLTLRKKTVEIYTQSFKNFLRICGNKPISKVTPLEVERFKQNRAPEVSAISVNIELRTLRAAFNEAKRLKVIEENPFQGMKLIRVPFKEASHLSECEFSRVLMIIADQGFRNLVKFAVFTMMRLGEITNLRWVDVDLVRREIHVRSNGEFRVKGGKPRTIPMNHWVYHFLESSVRRSEYVFSKRNGCPLSSPAVSRRFKRYVRKAGLNNGIHFHSLRHTGISWLINKGVPPQFVQHIAGHSSLTVTQVYTHLEDKNLITAINAFGQITG